MEKSVEQEQHKKLRNHSCKMMNCFFYIPYLYTNKAKLGKRGRLLSYFLILVVPPAYFAVVLQSSISWQNLLYVFLGTIIVQNIYEIGYIQNDTETIKRDPTPTLRLDNDSLIYYERNKFAIYASRVLWMFFLDFLILLSSGFSHDIIIFLIVSTLILPIFLIYNSIRNFWNLILHFVMTILKYTSVQFLFMSSFKPGIFVLSLFAYPIMNLFDRAATPRFFKKLSDYYIPRTAMCRMIYYSIFFLISGVLFFFNMVNFLSLCIVAFYFIYRLSIFMVRVK
jgi:hypothetical protein